MPRHKVKKQGGHLRKYWKMRRLGLIKPKIQQMDQTKKRDTAAVDVTALPSGSKCLETLNTLPESNTETGDMSVTSKPPCGVHNLEAIGVSRSVVDTQHFVREICDVASHVRLCGNSGYMEFVDIQRRKDLNDKLNFKCQRCGKIMEVQMIVNVLADNVVMNVAGNAN